MYSLKLQVEPNFCYSRSACRVLPLSSQGDGFLLFRDVCTTLVQKSLCGVGHQAVEREVRNFHVHGAPGNNNHSITWAHNQNELYLIRAIRPLPNRLVPRTDAGIFSSETEVVSPRQEIKHLRARA